MIIGVSGKRGSGKTTLGELLELKYGFTPVSFAATLKTMVKYYFNLTEDHVNGGLKEEPLPQWQNYTPRQIMIDFGQFFRRFDPDFWVKAAFKGLNLAEKNYIVTDVRFPNEANYIKSLGGALIRLNRASSLNIYKGEINDISETALDNFPHFDIIVPANENETMEQLDLTSRRVYDLVRQRALA